MSWVAVANGVIALGSAVYNYSEGEKGKKRGAEERKSQEARANEEAAAESRYQTEMASAQADAERLQAEGNKAEFDRQAEAERLRSEKEVANTANLATKLKKTQIALAAKAGFSTDSGTSLDITNETDKLSQQDINTIRSTSGEKQTALKQMGLLDLQTALESGFLRKKGAAGQGELLQLKAKGTKDMAALREKMVRAEANRQEANALFSLSNSWLAAGTPVKKDNKTT